MKQLFLKLSWLPASLLLVACWKEPEYPVEPHIEFKRISQEATRDTFDNDIVRIEVALDFTDGDGDLGLDSEEILVPPYKDPNDPTKANNYFIKGYIKINGTFIYDPDLTLANGDRYPRLEPTNQVQSLEGELRYTFPIFTGPIPLKYPDFKSGDSVKFDIYITDRKFNKSNTITTTPVPVFER